MASPSMVLLTVLIIFPIMSALDFGMSVNDFGLWFGILALIVVEVGLITPPVGMSFFIINSMDPETRIDETYRGGVAICCHRYGPGCDPCRIPGHHSLAGLGDRRALTDPAFTQKNGRNLLSCGRFF